MNGYLQATFLAFFSFLIVSCATTRPPPAYDYTAFKASRPRSILVLPPVSHSPDIKASLSFLSVTTFPLAEAGYYVLPVALTYETFKQNGITVADDAQNIPFKKLRKIFGADAGLYITVDAYGSTYRIVNSDVTVSAHAKLVDLASGITLWQGMSSASSKESNNSSGGTIIGMLITAAVNQVIHEVGDSSHALANVAAQRLLRSGTNGGLLYGPYHPKFEQQQGGPPEH